MPAQIMGVEAGPSMFQSPRDRGNASTVTFSSHKDEVFQSPRDRGNASTLNVAGKPANRFQSPRDRGNASTIDRAEEAAYAGFNPLEIGAMPAQNNGGGGRTLHVSIPSRSGQCQHSRADHIIHFRMFQSPRDRGNASTKTKHVSKHG